MCECFAAPKAQQIVEEAKKRKGEAEQRKREAKQRKREAERRAAAVGECEYAYTIRVYIQTYRGIRDGS